MIKLIFIWYFTLSFISLKINSQDKLFSVRKIESIDPFLNFDSDLSFLDSVLKGKRIVLLGEETHFDGSSLLARQRLINYLHTKLGFNTLCLELNFFEVDKAYQDILLKRDSVIGVMAYLTEGFPDIITPDNEALAKTIEGSKVDLKLFGLDIIPGSIYYNSFYSEFKKFVNAFTDYETSSLKKYFEAFGLKGYRSSGRISKVLNDSKKVAVAISNGEKLISELENFYPLINKNNLQESCSFFVQVIKCNIMYYKYIMESKKNEGNSKKPYNIYKPNVIRDRQMAENLLWILSKLDSSSKLIVALSSFHIGRNFKMLNPSPIEIDSTYKTFGDLLYERFPGICYSVAFVAFQGYRGHPLSDQQKEWFKKNTGSVEQILHGYDLPYLFVDNTSFENTQAWNKGPLFMQPTFEQSYKNYWNYNYDSFFFIDRMQEVRIRYILNRTKKEQPYNLPEGW